MYVYQPRNIGALGPWVLPDGLLAAALRARLLADRHELAGGASHHPEPAGEFASQQIAHERHLAQARFRERMEEFFLQVRDGVWPLPTPAQEQRLLEEAAGYGEDMVAMVIRWGRWVRWFRS